MVWGRPKAAPEEGLSLARRLLEGSRTLERDAREATAGVPARESYRGHHFELPVVCRNEHRTLAEGGRVMHCAFCEAATGLKPAAVGLTSEDIWNASQVQ